MFVPGILETKIFTHFGGDFFDLRRSPHGCDVLIADISGHDLGASYIALLLKTLFHEEDTYGCDGAGLFQALNEKLVKTPSTERVISAALVQINFEKRIAEVVSAGHPPIIRLRKGISKPYSLKLSGDLLGSVENPQFSRRQLELKEGDRYFLYTDGIIGARVAGKEDNSYGEGRLKKQIETLRSHSLQETVESVWEDVLQFCGHSQVDDMLLLGFELSKFDTTILYQKT